MSRPAMLAAVVLCAACSRREPVTSCEQALGGVWRTEAGERWMIIDRGATLEAYPLFPDGRPPGVPAELETAPRAIDLSRTPEGLGGDVKRRFMRRGSTCTSKANVRVTACAADVVELVLADPPVPVGFDPCALPRPDSSRRERWRHE